MSDNWKTICTKADLTPNTGVCALFDGEQVAIFWEGKNDKLYAVSNYDPIGEANVLSRGILGSLGDKLVVASPLYKQHYCLESGVCLEEEEHTLKTYSVRELDGEVQLQVA